MSQPMMSLHLEPGEEVRFDRFDHKARGNEGDYSVLFLKGLDTGTFQVVASPEVIDLLLESAVDLACDGDKRLAYPAGKNL